MAYIMVGAGGTASHLYHALYMYLKSREDVEPNWELHIYDGDEVMTNNLERQVFTREDLGKNKAIALVESTPDTDHLFAYDRFLGADELPKVIQDGDTVLIMVDNMFIRARIEEHCKTLKDVSVINAGNELISGSVQLWVREKGKNLTPPLSYLHPEITNTMDADRSAMSCADIAKLPGGGQTVLANMSAAALSLAALYRLHEKRYATEKGKGNTPWTEVQFDHKLGTIMPWDVRTVEGWQQA